MLIPYAPYAEIKHIGAAQRYPLRVASMAKRDLLESHRLNFFPKGYSRDYTRTHNYIWTAAKC